MRIGEGLRKHASAEAVGAKAANLARIAALGVPVPPAFVLPVKLCAAVIKGDAHAEAILTDGLHDGIVFLERLTERRFGDRRRPLLVSVRSGAARSMPGMLDTVLDVGCTAAAVRGLVRMTGNPRFAWDCRQRFLEGYATIVAGLDRAPFAEQRNDILAQEGAANDWELDGEALERLAVGYNALLGAADSSDDAMEHLVNAARAVYRSWMSDRAQTYRRLENVEDLPGTAVMVQAMVFGNRGGSSGAGVAFSRDPSTGAAQPVIDVLFDAQGEDIVSGRRTPETETALARALPAVAAELRDLLMRLEREFGDVQDVEFTIEEGRLFILQTRAAKRTPRAALRIAIDLVHEGLIPQSEALARLARLDLDALAQPRLIEPGDPIAHGVAASSGIAVGRAAFDSASARQLADCGDPVILMRPDTSTADIAGFAIAAGIVTAVGGRTAHAALVARQMGRPCVVGCDRIAFDSAGRRAQVGGAAIEEGDWLSVDGDNGIIYPGRRDVLMERPDDELAEIAHWRAIDAAGRSPRKPDEVACVARSRASTARASASGKRRS
jgi:pyruvate,orthophosphate dikinase